jgi:pimeloyl-ACP methyl ester carboxylesterase
MAAHSTDATWYVANCADTNDTDLWYKVYEEMFHSAYDTTTLIQVSNIFDNANNYSNDTIPIGIMNYSYYGLKDDALSTNNYFNFDTINTILTDIIPRPSWPYTDDNTIFMGAPLQTTANFSNPIFTINPQFFYFDSYNAAHFAKNCLLNIDFGDGTGWHSFDPTVVSYYQANYANITNPPAIRVQSVNQSTASVWGSSVSRFFPGGMANVPPDETIVIPGLNVGVYNSCTTTGKTVIYLEGIDPLDFIRSQNRSVATIFNTMLRNNRIIELRNQGYRFVVVDWKNSRIDMRFNALYVVNLIQQLKQQLPDDEQFVVIGESMGGVVARYALTYMESREYAAQSTAPFFEEMLDPASTLYLATHQQIFSLPTNWVLPEKMHNTRLFISMDAPHQGANVPLSIQKAYETAIGSFSPYISAAFQITTAAFNLFLDSKATKQLLIEHIKTESGTGFYKRYSNHSARVSFMAQLNSMGSYPQFAKIMLMSNGALDGSNQLNPYTFRPRQANDRLIEWKVDLHARVLGIKVPFFGGNITARTNPNGRGQILQANAGMFAIRIKLKWFGIKVYADYNSLFNIQDYANTKPYCTSAGSYQGRGRIGLIGSQPSNTQINLGTDINNVNNVNNSWALNLFGVYHVVDGNGCSSTGYHLGWNGYLSTNFDMSLCTDGVQFGFIPTYSALDYNANGSLNTDIQNTPIAIKLANIPERVDVIVGIPRGLYAVGPSSTPVSNINHLNFRNDEIFNLTNASAPFPNPFSTYFSCINGSPDNVPRVRRGFLNLEIGDEELYLENNSLQYNAQYKVEYDLHLNERNRYYQYTSSPNPLPAAILRGIYSKQDAFSIAPTGFATFIYDDTNGPAGHIGFYGTTIGNFTQLDQPLDNCCVRFSTLNKGGASSNIVSAPKLIPTNKNSFFQLFPNPNLGSTLNLKYKFYTNGNLKLTILSMQGLIMFEKNLYVPNNKQEITSGISINGLQLPSGSYFVKLTNGYETLISKLSVIK